MKHTILKVPGSVIALMVITAALLGSLARSGAQTWPQRPVKIIVSQAAGGTPDIICRLISAKLSAALGQQFIVENRPGGANVVGASAAAHAPADGYTLFFATAAALVSNPHTFKSLPYDPLKDFAAVSMIAINPFIVLANRDVSANTLSELVAYDKANPGKLTFATDGPRNFSGILATWLNKISGANILQVPYATMPQGVQDTVAGRTQLTILAIPSAAPHIATGVLKPLAVSWAKRVAQFPQVAAIAETFPGIELTGWLMFVAPAATSTAIITQLNREIDIILKAPDLVARLAELGFFTTDIRTPEAARSFILAQYELWAKVVREIGLQPE
jgi:tripartite-type tricarboxylate transporter receptor subunit TctC